MTGFLTSCNVTKSCSCRHLKLQQMNVMPTSRVKLCTHIILHRKGHISKWSVCSWCVCVCGGGGGLKQFIFLSYFSYFYHFLKLSTNALVYPFSALHHIPFTFSTDTPSTVVPLLSILLPIPTLGILPLLLLLCQPLVELALPPCNHGQRILPQPTVSEPCDRWNRNRGTQTNLLLCVDRNMETERKRKTEKMSLIGYVCFCIVCLWHMDKRK